MSTVTADGMKNFIRSLSVRVVSCHDVKPRRRRRHVNGVNDNIDYNNDDCSVITKAFRVCINSDDKDLLLDADKWPAYVAICEWFFKPARKLAGASNTDDKSKKRIRVDNDSPVGTGELLSSQIVTDSTDMDTTILAGTPGYPETISFN